MSDRPTSPDPAAQHPAPGPAGPPAGDAGWSAPAVPTASAAVPVRSGPRRWWDDATSTGAGRGALIAVGVLAALLLVIGVGLTAAFVARHAGAGRDGLSWSSDRGPGPGMGKGNGKGNGWGQGKGRQGNGNGMMGDRDDAVPPPGGRTGPGNGSRNGMGLGRGAAMLGAGVLHGEFTTDVTGTPAVMVVQTGQVTAYTAGKSLTVRSTDGFEATYTLDGSAVQARGSTTLATGVQVRVLAAKQGMKVTALLVG